MHLEDVEAPVAQRLEQRPCMETKTAVGRGFKSRPGLHSRFKFFSIGCARDRFEATVFLRIMYTMNADYELADEIATIFLYS